MLIIDNNDKKAEKNAKEIVNDHFIDVAREFKNKSNLFCKKGLSISSKAMEDLIGYTECQKICTKSMPVSLSSEINTICDLSCQHIQTAFKNFQDGYSKGFNKGDAEGVLRGLKACHSEPHSSSIDDQSRNFRKPLLPETDDIQPDTRSLDTVNSNY